VSGRRFRALVARTRRSRVRTARDERTERFLRTPAAGVRTRSPASSASTVSRARVSRARGSRGRVGRPRAHIVGFLEVWNGFGGSSSRFGGLITLQGVFVREDWRVRVLFLGRAFSFARARWATRGGDRVDGDARERERAIETFASVSRRGGNSARVRGHVDQGGVR